MNLCLAVVGVVTLALFWLVPPLGAQLTLVGKVKSFKVPEFYPPAEGVLTNRLKMLMTGSNAQPMLSGHLLINGLRIENFREAGPSESVMKAPQCVFEMSSRSASSTGRLEMVSSDGRYSIEGDGFLWRTTNSSLIISNNVRTLIRKDAVKQLDPSQPEVPKVEAQKSEPPKP